MALSAQELSDLRAEHDRKAIEENKERDRFYRHQTLLAVIKLIGIGILSQVVRYNFTFGQGFIIIALFGYTMVSRELTKSVIRKLGL